MRVFERRIVATAADADALGHVNNAVWVRWIQDMATAHWEAVAPAEHRDSHVWVVTRHEMKRPPYPPDTAEQCGALFTSSYYLRAVLPGETLIGRTWVGEAPKGARFDRHVEFVGDDGRPRVRAKTIWAIIDRATGRPVRVPAEVAAPFLG
ncbi:MAG TPA: thioesterase family protein [Allosphingosinicella sp.]|nr:thioesterase family protein [Allosphingosinicella sp.]